MRKRERKTAPIPWPAVFLIFIREREYPASVYLTRHRRGPIVHDYVNLRSDVNFVPKTEFLLRKQPPWISFTSCFAGLSLSQNVSFIG